MDVLHPFGGKRLETAPSGEPRVSDLLNGQTVVSHVPAEGSARRAERATLFRKVSIGIAVTDALSVIAALIAGYVIRFPGTETSWGYLLLMIAAPIVWVGVSYTYDLYTPWRLPAVEEFRRCISAASIGMVFMALVSFWSHASFSRAWVGLTFILALTLDLLARWAWRRDIAKARADGRLLSKAVVFGSEADERRLTDLSEAQSLGIQVVGRISIAGRRATDEDASGERMARLAALAETLESTDADTIYISPSSLTPEEMTGVMRTARQREVDVNVTVGLPGLLATRINVHSHGDSIALSLRRTHFGRAKLALKRAIDIVGSAIGLIAFLPVLLIVAVLIKLTSRGPILFKQERLTKGGKSFRMYKFRTMRRDGDRLLREQGIDPSQPFFKLGEQDPRLTRLGRVLRKLSLDELPQLINILKGEMSIVGPRPLPVDQVVTNLEILGPRHEVAAGLTGWWQISGRSEMDAEEAVRMDQFYIENWSPALDLYILLKTVGVVISRRGAV